MTAYNITSLDNRVVREQAGEAQEKKCISPEECVQIKAIYPCDLYTPNIYMRIGLFLLTLVIVAFSVGLLALLFAMGGANEFGGLLIFSGLVSYVVLEYMVRGKKHFRSGVDNALLWISVILVFSGLAISAEPGFLAGYGMLFILALGCWLRFADRIMGLLAYAALLGVVFYLIGHLGETGKFIMPFVLMAVSAAVYLIAVPFASDVRARHYHDSLVLIKAACLVSFYAAGNYFIVQEAGIVFFNRSPDAVVPVGWLFRAFTALTPLIYIYYGIKKKDKIFLWMGLVLVAAMVFTIRHYYHILPLELAMVVGGMLLIAIAYGSVKYLKNPWHGFTSAETGDRHWVESLHIESLVIAETFAATTPPAGDDFQFGGGSGDGGGAGGQY
jgi:hypothetical protein